MSKTYHRLPDNLNPAEDICFPLFVPNDPQWIAALHGAIRILTQDRYWERDEVEGAETIAVRNRWNTTTYLPLIDSIYNDEQCADCADALSSCFHVDTTSEAFTYYPNDPFVNTPEIQTIVAGMTWRRWEDTDIENSDFFQFLEDTISYLLGYYPNDVIVFPSKLLDFAFSNILDLINFVTFQVFPFPYVQYEFEGDGEAEIEFINFPFGCSALLIPDLELSFQGLIDAIIEIIDNDGDLPAGWVFTELNRDIFELETAATQSQEIAYTESGSHNLTVVFIPRLSISPPFFFPFGGIREIEVCGNLKLIGSQTGEIIDKNNAGLSQHTRQGVVPVSTITDIRDGFIQAIEELSRRILFASDTDNIKADITLDKDSGKVTFDIVQETKQAVEGTEDELNYGGIHNQALQIKQLFDDINAYIAIPYATATIQSITRSFVDIDPIEDPTKSAAWDAAIAAYVTASPAFAVNADDLADLIWCNGLGRGLTNYAIAVATFSETNLNIWSNIVFEIPKITYSDWFDEGSLTPNQGYQNTPCYTYPVSTLVMPYDEYAVSYHDFITNGMSNRKVRVKIEVVSPMVAANGDKWDGIYFDPFDAAPNTSYAIAMHNGSSFKNIDSVIPPYLNGTGEYFVEYNCNSNITGIRVNPSLGSVEAFTPISGLLRFTVYDLGIL